MREIKKRKYFGKTFWKGTDGYWDNNMPIHAQRWVWINHHGAIPKGMDIHHKDGDKDNNDIGNLEMLSRSDHLKRHWASGSFDLDKRRVQLTEARKWLKTPEGKKAQSELSKEAWEKRPQIARWCENCGKEFRAFFKRAKFCCDPCGYQSRRRRAKKPILSPRTRHKKECIRCKKTITAAMPYARYCSSRCRKGKFI